MNPPGSPVPEPFRFRGATNATDGGNDLDESLLDGAGEPYKRSPFSSYQ